MVVEELSPTRRHIYQHASERQSVSGILDMSGALVQSRQECILTVDGCAVHLGMEPVAK